MKKNNKGFTLAELLIVVAIIAVLVAIAIPIFTTQLEKSREGVDLANIRAAYAECAAEAVTNADSTTTGFSKAVVLKQQTLTSWVVSPVEVAGVDISSATLAATVYVNVSSTGAFTLTTAATSGYTVLD